MSAEGRKWEGSKKGGRDRSRFRGKRRGGEKKKEKKW